MKLLSLLFASLLFVSICSAKTGKIQRAKNLSKDEFSAVLEHCKAHLPKIWETLNSIRESGVNVRLTAERKMGPGKASGTDQIVISTFFLTKDLPKYPEDRLVIVLHHEFGHILFNRETKRSQRNPVKHEFFAFAYSIKMAIQLAENGDSGPLEQVVKNLGLRNENGKPKDPHTIAIKQLIKTPLWTIATEMLEGN
tara:strand:- start:97 stop:684 length:588 start_codon:yes stop_codon:yes gene_type:complete